MEIGKILKAQNMTKAAFAEKMGIAPQNVNVLFKNPTEQRIKDAAAVLGVSVSQLLGEPCSTQDTGNDFCAFVRCHGRNYTPETLADLRRLIEELEGAAAH